MKFPGKNTANLVLAAMFSAIIAALTLVSFTTPSGVPATLQTFAVALCGYLLGWKRAAAAVAVYLLVGAVGVPVFSGLRGGIGVLAGRTGGFLIGFLPMAALCGIRPPAKKVLLLPVRAAWGIAGTAVCHALGTGWFAIVTKSSYGAAIALVSFPFIIKDLISIAGALALSAALGSALKKAGLLQKFYLTV